MASTQSKDSRPWSPPSNAPWVAVCLLNYGNAHLTCRALESLKNLTYPNLGIVVVDNHSPDDSAQILQAAQDNPDFPPFTLLLSPKNGGYSAGNNLAITHAMEHPPKGESYAYLWLLNNDTTVDPDALGHLITIAETHQWEEPVLVGSRICHPDGSFQQAATRINGWTGQARGIPEKHLSDGQIVPALTGASLLIPTPVINAAGKLDERYFLYFEDVEYCIRAQKLGFRALVALDSLVYHDEGGTTGKGSPNSQYYYQRNRLKTMMAYGSPLQRWTIQQYTRFRLFRSWLKSKQNPGRRNEYRILKQAVIDAMSGVEGQCPHDWKALLQP